MYQLNFKPEAVQPLLSQFMLADGLDLILDMEKSEGMYVFDSKYQRKLLDFFTCFASIPLGYNHPKMLKDENFKHHLLLAALTNPSNSEVYTQQYAQFVDTFSKVALPGYLKHVFFIAGGTMAIENALKVAMDWKVQKNFAKGYQSEKGFKVIHFEQAFHGRSGYALGLTNTAPDKTKWYAKFDWPRITSPYIEFPLDENNLAAVIKKEQEAIAQIKKVFLEHKDEVCAIIIEPIQSEGGDNHIRAEFFEELRKLSDENECFLIYDEIQSGVGLTGKFWCHQHFGLNARPDIIAFGKKMQVCGIAVGPKADQIETNVFKVSSRISSTWGGNLTDMVRATQILHIIAEDKLLENAAQTGAYLLEKIEILSKEYPEVTNARGRGLMCAFDLPDTAIRDRFISQGLKKNALFLGCSQKTIRFRPALNIQKHHIDEGFEIMQKLLSE